MDKPLMHPWPGERLLKFVGDSVRFSLRGPGHRPLPDGWRALLRTNLGRASVLRSEVIDTHSGKLPIAGASWRDIPLRQTGGEWQLDICLTEVGYFQAKAYAVDREGRQYWPDGPDVGVSVHPSRYRTANTIYCAFVRLFGETRTARSTKNDALEQQLGKLEKYGYSVIPPSGKLRDLAAQLPHIIDTLGCRILHLLPVNPVPTTYARFGRFGSPYACQDLTAIDPALVEFDRRTTGIDQFRELTYAAHARGARVILDVVVNHTGWGSTLQERHPEWFLRSEDGTFVSPGAWGVTWEDLVELDHRNSAPWDEFAEAFLTWCRRGVDGFRCDAGYKVPMPAWRYIIARVHQEFPETVFLLEGLGGSWEATEHLLTEGGMQWAYSELFQNYSGSQVSHYLNYAHNQSRRVGLYVHYSETHDNDRLAKRGRAWSLLRNQLCGLTSVSGAFAFTCGVEWLTSEKIDVHRNTGLAWDSPDNIITELARLNRLLVDHPCFFDDAKLTRLSADDSPIYALRRVSGEGADTVLVLVNTDAENVHRIVLPTSEFPGIERPLHDLLGGGMSKPKRLPDQRIELEMGPGACYCVSPHPKPQGLSGEWYRSARAIAAWASTALSHVLPVETIGNVPWRRLSELVEQNPAAFLAAVSRLLPETAAADLLASIEAEIRTDRFRQIVVWRPADRTRITLAPPGHWLLVEDQTPFRASLVFSGQTPQHAESIQIGNLHFAAFPPAIVAKDARDAHLLLERYNTEHRHVEASLRYLAAGPVPQPPFRNPDSDLVLLTNGRGGMARLLIHFGQIRSKYDCLLAANLHPSVPADRHIFAKRARVWVNADGFISPLDRHNLAEFDPGPPARWRFIANAGDRRTVEIQLEAEMLPDRNCVVLRFTRPLVPPASGGDLPAHCDVRLTVRVDIEDRNFHHETKRTTGADHHFSSNCRPLRDRAGFEFTPANDRQFRVFATAGRYHHEAEWTEHIAHPIEASRGQAIAGDAYSPGWFDLPLSKGETVTIVATADPGDPDNTIIAQFASVRRDLTAHQLQRSRIATSDWFGQRLVMAVHAFVVRRGAGRTMIAGYPWFLDWGRDSLICARGLLAAGMHEEVKQLLVTFGHFEQDGTLPNSIYGDDASNRDTSDAPLWYGVVCREAAAAIGPQIYDVPVHPDGRTIADVLRSIAQAYIRGTPNGIRVDSKSGLVWSPKHFSWMDTNFPAATPRAGYPIEIQVLWIALLRQLGQLDASDKHVAWNDLAETAEQSLRSYFWIEERGYLSDLLISDSYQPAASAAVDHALRSNCLFAISSGLIRGEQARRCVDAALRHLVVPGALRSLAPLPTTPPLAVHGNDGHLLNNPDEPYWGRYEGDEDTRRKPAYHNGTAWTWTFPTFCEALVRAWDKQPEAVAAARAYLGSMDRFFSSGCIGQIPEIVDGDAPHTQRGCDAQAWGATEGLRVWLWLNELNHK